MVAGESKKIDGTTYEFGANGICTTTVSVTNAYDGTAAQNVSTEPLIPAPATAPPVTLPAQPPLRLEALLPAMTATAVLAYPEPATRKRTLPLAQRSPLEQERLPAQAQLRPVPPPLQRTARTR